MEIFLIRALQLITSLSILVFIHEFGHFLFARIFKIRVEKFYLFFDWGFSLIMRPSKSTNKEDKALIKLPAGKGETEYGIGWLPLGGYCKISGMIDESMDTEQMKQPAQPWEFRSKPAWQRLLVMIGGVMFNFILALFIYSMVLYSWGEEYTDLQKATYGMEFNDNAKALGFQDGDIIMQVDGADVHRLDADLLRAIADGKEVLVQRNGAPATVAIPDSFGLLDMNSETAFMRFRLPAVMDSIVPNMPAALAGMKSGDKVVKIGGIDVDSWTGLNHAMATMKQEGRNEIEVIVMRDSLTALNVNVDSTFMLGVTIEQIEYPTVKIEYGFFESFPAGVKYGCNVLKGYVSDFKYLFSKEGAQSVGMFGTIGSLFPPMWDWHLFWMMTAMLSIILAVMNILPIPALDGGHVLFLLIEIITRKKPSDKVLEYAQMIGMGILLCLFVLATYNDIMRFIF
ncbi:MAG: RIP metalloprotease RseP [Bacteroidaceae bacterium]|nr:RIP metalloprotease RseP [Bacteroidaceae bacterium]